MKEGRKKGRKKERKKKKERKRKKGRKKERKKDRKKNKKTERKTDRMKERKKERNRSSSTIARTGPFCYSSAWKPLICVTCSTMPLCADIHVRVVVPRGIRGFGHGVVRQRNLIADSSHDSSPVPNGDHRLEYSEGLQLATLRAAGLRCTAPTMVLPRRSAVCAPPHLLISHARFPQPNESAVGLVGRPPSDSVFGALSHQKKHHHHHPTCTCNPAHRPQCVQHATPPTPSTCEAQT